jgi:type I site-specific restriction endonuclease
MSNSSEARTRRELIDPALERAGWDLGSSAQQREAQRQAEHVFESLLHRAFLGEL